MSRCRLRLIPGLLILLLIPVSTPTIAASPLRQGLEDVISIRIDPGYNGRFRAQDWFPLRIEVENNGVDVDGQLVVRPETTDGVINTFSTPISLPNGARKTAFLYIIAQNHTQQVRVELLDPNGLVVTESETVIRSLLPQDQLVMVVSATNRPLDLTSVAVGGYGTSQGNWSIENIPDRAAALDAISLMVINDIDTGTLTPAQEQALAGWVAGGGHMVVAGGPNWEATAAGLDNLLPFVPEDSETVETMAGMETLVGDRATQLSGQTVVATGTVLPGAQVLAISPDDLPLLIRHTPGLGTVDYLVADPTLPPLRNWDRLPDLWVSLMTSVVPLPGWSQGFNDNSKAVQAIQILPGVNLLPEVLAMCAFLGVYIALIGPLNYLVLARLNRRELACVTIPGFIIVFSVLAWTIGFNLRGDEVTLSRLTVVRSWPDSETARVDQLIGLLSPRRANYDLVMTDERLLRPLQDTAQGTIRSRLSSVIRLR